MRPRAKLLLPAFALLVGACATVIGIDNLRPPVDDAGTGSVTGPDGGKVAPGNAGPADGGGPGPETDAMIERDGEAYCLFRGGVTLGVQCPGDPHGRCPAQQRCCVGGTTDDCQTEACSTNVTAWACERSEQCAGQVCCAIWVTGSSGCPFIPAGGPVSECKPSCDPGTMQLCDPGRGDSCPAGLACVEARVNFGQNSGVTEGLVGVCR